MHQRHQRHDADAEPHQAADDVMRTADDVMNLGCFFNRQKRFLGFFL